MSSNTNAKRPVGSSYNTSYNLMIYGCGLSLLSAYISLKLLICSIVSFDNPLFYYTRLNDKQIICGYNGTETNSTLYDESYASYNDETY